MNVFLRDDQWQRQIRDKILAPYFYGEYAIDGRYVFIDKGKLATRLQREYAVDTILQGKNGDAICIEEKIVRWPGANRGRLRENGYSAFTLETMTCTVPGRERKGWMEYGEADYLLYCFCNREETALNCYLIDFPALKDWFWPRIDTWSVTTTEQLNRSECRIVPIAEVEDSVPCWQRRAGPYDGADDFSNSLNVGYSAIRDRMAAGGPGWEPK
jgi:hypothetical protein